MSIPCPKIPNTANTFLKQELNTEPLVSLRRVMSILHKVPPKAKVPTFDDSSEQDYEKVFPRYSSLGPIGKSGCKPALLETLF